MPPFVNVIEPRGMCELREKHRAQMAEDTERGHHRFHIRLPRHLGDQAARNVMEKLSEGEKISADCCGFFCIAACNRCIAFKSNNKRREARTHGLPPFPPYGLYDETILQHNPSRIYGRHFDFRGGGSGGVVAYCREDG